MAFRAMYPIPIVNGASFVQNAPCTVPGIVPLNTQSGLLTRNGSSGLPSHSSKLEFEELDILAASNMEKANNTTPKAHKRPECPPPLKRKSDDESVCAKNGLIRKKLFRGQEKLRTHKLGDLYVHLLGNELDGGHRAENDTTALLECIVSTAPKFLSWIEKNHLHFSKIPCMW